MRSARPAVAKFALQQFQVLRMLALQAGERIGLVKRALKKTQGRPKFF